MLCVSERHGTMKAVVLKPVMWNTNGYMRPSGYPSMSGFSKDFGYGHEEWNNNPRRVWRDYKIFHTESTDQSMMPPRLRTKPGSSGSPDTVTGLSRHSTSACGRYT